MGAEVGGDVISPPVVPAERPRPSSSVPDQSVMFPAAPVVMLIALPVSIRTPLT
jgi:hypothetical protein